MLNNLWQFFLSLLIIMLPTQWLSNVTMAMILFHSWAEFFGVVLRFQLVRQDVTPEFIIRFEKWAMIIIVITGGLFITSGNPYVQGIITAVLVLPADFLNMFVAPILSGLVIKKYPEMSPAAKTAEIFMGVLYIIHVIWFYGQGILACAVSVEVGAKFFIGLMVTNVALFIGLNVAYAVDINSTKEWVEPIKELLMLFGCRSQEAEENAPLRINTNSNTSSD